MKYIDVLLSIAGFDPSGGAGLLADAKVAERLGLYPCGVISALTAQNTAKVSGVWPIEPDRIETQLESILSDFRPSAVKVGFLYSSDAVSAVVSMLIKHDVPNIVVDPVLSFSLSPGQPDERLVRSMVKELFPIATLVTPNAPEKEIIQQISGLPFDECCNAFLLKGGHSEENECADILYYKQAEDAHLQLPSTAFPTLNQQHSSLFNHDNLIPSPARNIDEMKTKVFRHKRIITENTHGSGCILSTATAGYLAKGFSLADSVEHAVRFTDEALRKSSKYKISEGNYGPALI